MSNFNEVIDKETEKLLGKTAKWLVCFECNKPLVKVYSNITCVDYSWQCPKCNIIVDKDIGQLYKCIRCNRVIEKTEDLIFEFITPNFKELSFCHKPTGIKQYLCPKCHGRAIKPLKLKKLRKFFFNILVFFYSIYRKIKGKKE